MVRGLSHDVGGRVPELGVLSPLSVGGTATVLRLYTNDVDALWDHAVEAGGEVRQPLQDVFWGERYGQITDVRPPLGPWSTPAQCPA